MSPQHVLGNFNGFLKSVILRVSEARDLGEVDRFKFYDHSKALTAAPPDVLRVNEKNLREHYVPNITGVIITTNHKTDGIFLCTLTVMTDEWQESPDGTRITLPGVHIQGAARNAIGVANLRTIGERLCEEINCDELVVEGAIRTTGANPGRTPDHLRFQRRRPASSA